MKICCANERKRRNQFNNIIARVCFNSFERLSTFSLAFHASHERWGWCGFCSRCDFPFFARALFFASENSSAIPLSFSFCFCLLSLFLLFFALARLCRSDAGLFISLIRFALNTESVLNMFQVSVPLPTLPLELQYLIGELALPTAPFSAYSEYQERTTILRRFALVHSSWLHFARTQLVRHLYVCSRTWSRPRTNRLGVEQALRSDRYVNFRVISLTLEECFGQAELDWFSNERRARLLHLECCSMFTPTTTFDLAKFKSEFVEISGVIAR